MNSHASVLVVDDEWTIRQQLSRALNSVGVECDCAANGDEALDKYRRRNYPLVVTDLRMPERHGHSLAVKLVDLPNRPKIIALTGVTEPRLAKDLVARGVDEVIFKPVNYFQLADRLKVMLSESRSTKETNENDEGEPALLNGTFSAPVHETAPSLKRPKHSTESSIPNHNWITTALQWIDWRRFENPPVEIRDLLHRMSRASPYAIPDRRRETRIVLNQVGIAIGLDDRFEPSDEPFKTMIRDVSQHGIGLVHTERIVVANLAVVWRTRSRRYEVKVARLVRCRKLEGAFDIAGRIID